MRSSFALRLLLAVGVMVTTSAGQSAVAPPTLTLSEYVQVLNSSLASVRALKADPQKAEEAIRNLPSAWRVEVDGKSFEVSTESLRQELGTWQVKHEAAALDRAERHLELLRDQASASEQSPPDFSSRRLALNNILSRHEFRNVRGQSWIDRLKRRINDFLLKWIGRAISGSAIPVISDVIVYGLIVIAVLALAYWMYRSLRESTHLETIMPVVVPVSAKKWPIWMAEARAAAARAEWSDAIHLAYWGGISFLEIQGAWSPDVARTPREYLRLLPATSGHQTALRSLTVRLESVWYGMQVADEEGFRQAVAELERLGCGCN
jgi:hypothetical protein